MNSISASPEPVSGLVVDSLPSAIHSYESSSSGLNDERRSPSHNVVEADIPIVTNDSDGGQVAESSLRPRAAKVNQPDYSYRALWASIERGTTPEPLQRHKRKRGVVTNDMDDVASLFDDAYEKFRQQHYSMLNKIKKVEENLLVSNKDNEMLKQQNSGLNQRKEEWKQLYQESTRKLKELQQQNEQSKQEIERHKDEIERLRETQATCCPVCLRSKNTETHHSPTQRLSCESYRLPSLDRKQELNPSHSDRQAVKKIRLVDPHIPLPSTEPESYQEEDLVFDEDYPHSELHSAPIFIDDAVIVGFWYADPSGNGQLPVYCFIKDFHFAYRKGDSFILTRDGDFDLLDELGDWLDYDTEDEKSAMSLDTVKIWVKMMWESRVYAGREDMIVEY